MYLYQVPFINLYLRLLSGYNNILSTSGKNKLHLNIFLQSTNYPYRIILLKLYFTTIFFSQKRNIDTLIYNKYKYF